jgi:hypothetical protein
MRAAKRSEEFATVQRESMQVVALLRKALFSVRRGDTPSPVQGGASKPPSPSGGELRAPSPSWRDPGWKRPRQFVLSRMGVWPITMGAGKVTDRRNSTLACYFLHCG